MQTIADVLYTTGKRLDQLVVLLTCGHRAVIAKIDDGGPVRCRKCA